MALLELRDLRTFFRTKRGTVKAVNGVSYSVDAGKVLGVVGESGSGKSVSAMSILRLLDNNGYIDGGEIYFEGRELTKLPMSEMYKIRGNEISVIFQEPMTSLNPVFTVERQLSEPLRIHQGMSKAEAKKQAQSLEAEGKAEAILAVQRATADSIKLMNEAAPSDQVIRIRALEAFAAAADGKATKIIIPSEIQGLAGLAEGVVQSVSNEPRAEV